MTGPAISLTPEASAHLASESEGRLLRIAFTTGCGGSGYRLSFTSEPIDDDVVVTAGEIRIAMDSMSASRLEGARIQYSEDEDGYTLEHPDAVAAVWCG